MNLKLSQYFVLHVDPPQSISFSVTRTLLRQGDVNLMSCHSSDAEPPPYYEVYLNGQLRQNTTEGRLSFVPITHADEGVWGCVARNYVGATEMKNITIDVTGR